MEDGRRCANLILLLLLTLLILLLVVNVVVSVVVVVVVAAAVVMMVVMMIGVHGGSDRVVVACGGRNCALSVSEVCRLSVLFGLTLRNDSLWGLCLVFGLLGLIFFCDVIFLRRDGVLA